MRVQPVLLYETPKRREATSWRSWGGIQTEEDAKKEQVRIAAELAKLKAQADFPVEFLPLVAAKNGDQAVAALGGTQFDTLLLYAAGGGGLEKLVSKDRHNLMFLRHDPGPVYLWYEIVHPRFLRKTVDEYSPTGMDVWDVVVDKQDDLLWRLRALSGLSNTLGKRIVAIGGAGGWGQGGQKAPVISKELWKLDLVDFPYKELEPRLKAAFANTALVKRAEEDARRFLRQSGVSLHTQRPFVNNAFVLTEVFKDIMDEAKTDAITVNHCMGTIMGMSKTTACLPLSQLNDEGYLAFCESDFVVIPSGILLHYISGKPVFLNDPTYPHDDIVTLAHCTAPRKMDGKKAERTKVLTHFESDYGAAPKVEMRLGQITTNLVPDFDCKKWVGFAGTIVGNPFLDICRSQVDVKVHGDSAALLEQMKGFHWMLSYGDYLKETGYVLKKLGVGFLNVSAPKVA
ncbi:MAG: sugar isomerase [Verrucomicrobia bacterium]|nr:sugar isomerase [Verrucomicrobiota bacterium]